MDVAEPRRECGPLVVVVEGTVDRIVDIVCGQAYNKLITAPQYEDTPGSVRCIQRLDPEPVGLASVEAATLMRGVQRHEFDAAVGQKVRACGNERVVFLLGRYYDTGTVWRRPVAEPSIGTPDMVFYVESMCAAEDPRRAAFTRCMANWGVANVTYVRAYADKADEAHLRLAEAHLAVLNYVLFESRGAQFARV